MSLIVYIHGFNSSASSYKAGVIQSAIQDHDKELQFWCPDLPHWPNEAVACLEREISQHDEVTLIGSSLGGYYATYLTKRLGHRCVLINRQKNATLPTYLRSVPGRVAIMPPTYTFAQMKLLVAWLTVSYPRATLPSLLICLQRFCRSPLTCLTMV